MSGPVRALLVAFGVVLVVVGFFWRSLEADWGHQLDVPPYTDYSHGQAEDGTWQVVGWEGDYWVEPADDGSFVVLHAVQGQDLVEVFRGSEEDAQFYKESQAGVVLVSGARAEVDVWIQEHERGSDMLLPTLLIAAGALTAVTGLVLRKPRTSTIGR